MAPLMNSSGITDTVALLSLAAIAAKFPACAHAASQAGTSDVETTRIRATCRKAPLLFEGNRGQTDPQVRYLSRGSGYTLFLTPREAVIALNRKAMTGRASVSAPVESSVLRMTLLGSNVKPGIHGEGRMRTRIRYGRLDGSMVRQHDVPACGKVRYRAVYPGVDLVYYGNQRQLEYDFLISPGADPKAIRLSFTGADRLRLDKAGDLVASVFGSEVCWKKPVAYQEVGGSGRRWRPSTT